MASIQTDHQVMVAALAKDGAAIIKDLTPTTAHMLHMSACVMGEAGELFDNVKRLAIYKKPLTKQMLENFLEEFGDIEFYLEGLRQGLNALIEESDIRNEFGPITRTLTLDDNIKKLSMRYAEKTYSNEAAIARADKP